jgi:hypothetical protein
LSKKRKPRKRKGLFNRGLVRLAAIAVIIGCAVLLITTEKDCREKRLRSLLFRIK